MSTEEKEDFVRNKVLESYRILKNMHNTLENKVCADVLLKDKNTFTNLSELLIQCHSSVIELECLAISSNARPDLLDDLNIIKNQLNILRSTFTKLNIEFIKTLNLSYKIN